MRGLAVLLGALLIAGCGGSKSTSTSVTTTTAATFPPATTTAPTTSATTPPKTTATSTPKTTATTTTGAINVRVPARFTIADGGSVTPPTITIPAHLPVELIVIGDAQAHRINLRATSFTVGAHEQAERLIDDLPVGRYPLKVDGTPKATLTIGGEPGP